MHVFATKISVQQVQALYELYTMARVAALTLILKTEMPEVAKWRAMQKPARVTQLPYMPSRPDRQNMPPKACNAYHTLLSVSTMFTTMRATGRACLERPARQARGFVTVHS